MSEHKTIQNIFELVKQVAFDARDVLANSTDMLMETKNVHGDEQTRFDRVIDDLIIRRFRDSRLIKVIHTEESAPCAVAGATTDLEIFIDPVDGSKNSSINGCMGSLFGIFKEGRIIAAAYVLYGIKTIIVTAYDEVSEYILSPEGKFEFVGTIGCLPRSRYLYIGGSYDVYPAKTQELVNGLIGQHPKIMYDQAFVVNMHNLIRQGGVYLYPATEKYPDGKLRLMFEGKTAPFIIEKLGGAATDFETMLVDVPGVEETRSKMLIGDKEQVEKIMKN